VPKKLEALSIDTVVEGVAGAPKAGADKGRITAAHNKAIRIKEIFRLLLLRCL
jgi:hypothetical protein